jgi:hypothetical protein
MSKADSEKSSTLNNLLPRDSNRNCFAVIFLAVLMDNDKSSNFNNFVVRTVFHCCTVKRKVTPVIK